MDTQPNYFATAIQYWPAAVISIIATASINRAVTDNKTRIQPPSFITP